MTGCVVPRLMVSDGVVSGWAGHCAWRVSPRLTTFLPACWSAVSIWVSGSVVMVVFRVWQDLPVHRLFEVFDLGFVPDELDVTMFRFRFDSFQTC